MPNPQERAESYHQELRGGAVSVNDLRERGCHASTTRERRRGGWLCPESGRGGSGGYAVPDAMNLDVVGRLAAAHLKPSSDEFTYTMRWPRPEPRLLGGTGDWCEDCDEELRVVALPSVGVVDGPTYTRIRLWCGCDDA